MPIETPPGDEELQGESQEVDQTQEGQDLEFTPEEVDGDHNDPRDAGALNVKLALSPEKKVEISSYLEENLINMTMSEDDQNRLKSYLSMYDMAVARRDFPYENAPSLPSSDAYDKLNEWLDKAEVAFLITNGTFAIDRQEVNLDEQVIRRMEKTWHKKYFWGSGFASELRLILFEAGFLGGSILSTRETFDVEPQREKVVIKTVKDLTKYQPSITKADYDGATAAVSRGQIYLAERDILKVVFAGPKIGRVNQTKFLYPQNEPDFRKWEIVSEKEFYTKSTLYSMAEMGEIEKDELDKAIGMIKERANYEKEKDKDKKGKELPEAVKPSDLDLSHKANMSGLTEYGDAYEEELCVYRTTMKYKVKTDEDPSGIHRSWVEVIYCPAGRNVLSSTFCKYGFPYDIVQYRPVPHKAIGSGIAQARYPFNMFDADMKSLFMACLEQEIGAPTLIRKDSDLWASGFRTYPGSTAYTKDPANDVKVFAMPEKSRLATEGMKIVLGSSPDANKGAGYASGKREQILQEQRNVTDQSRMHAIAVGLDAPMNKAWKIMCQVSKLNDNTTKWVDWVYSVPPTNTKLYMLENEMDPQVVWTSVLSAISMSPDALYQQAIQDYQMFHEQVPVSVNSPRLSMAWLKYLAGFRPQMDEKHQAELLPNMQDFQQYQQSLGQMGGQREGQSATTATAQSSTTPFHRPPSGPQHKNEPPQQNGRAFSPRTPLPNGASEAFSPKNPIP